jgi:hypothetical protein
MSYSYNHGIVTDGHTNTHRQHTQLIRSTSLLLHIKHKHDMDDKKHIQQPVSGIKSTDKQQPITANAVGQHRNTETAS